MYNTGIVRWYRRNSESGTNLSIYKYISIKLVELEREMVYDSVGARDGLDWWFGREGILRSPL